MLTFEQIKELIDLVCERQLQGVEIERSGFRLRIEGQAQAPTSAQIVGAEETASVTALQTTPNPPSAAPEKSQPVATAEKIEESSVTGHILKSPIVGTFYRAPSPEANPYVEVGERVKKGQVLCIVEAMKLMNEIESDQDGVIEEIYPQNAQPVEFGEPLFLIQ